MLQWEPTYSTFLTKKNFNNDISLLLNTVLLSCRLGLYMSRSSAFVKGLTWCYSIVARSWAWPQNLVLAE